jgi:hypothetical protein
LSIERSRLALRLDHSDGHDFAHTVKIQFEVTGEVQERGQVRVRAKRTSVRKSGPGNVVYGRTSRRNVRTVSVEKDFVPVSNKGKPSHGKLVRNRVERGERDHIRIGVAALLTTDIDQKRTIIKNQDATEPEVR